MVLCHSNFACYSWTKPDFPQAQWECPAAAMLTTFIDPMCKCSSWNYDVLCCRIKTLDELSGWEFNIWSSSNVLNSDLSLWSTIQPSRDWGCGGAVSCCPYPALWGTLGLTMGCDASRMPRSSGADGWKHEESKQMQTNLAHLDC